MVTKYYEYHCLQSHDSADAELWYRSQQPVSVIRVVEPGGGRTQAARAANGEPRVMRIRFSDGYEADAFEDELLRSPKHYQAAWAPGVPE